MQGDLRFKMLIEAQNDARKEIERLQKEIRQLKRETKQAGDDMQQSFGKRMPRALATLGGALAGLAIGDRLIQFGKGAIVLAGNLEQAKIAFETMLGSAEEADILIRDLSEFAKTTPFELTGIRQNAKQLLAMGISLEELLPTLKSLGDVSAGLSVPLERLALNYGQVIAQGKLTGRELRDFTVAGVPLLDQLSKQVGKTTVEIQGMISDGEITSDIVVEAFRNMTGEGGRFFNLMDKQSKTLHGSWSNLQDALDQLGETLGGSVLSPLKQITKDLTALVEATNETVSSLNSVPPELTRLQGHMESLSTTYLENEKELEELTDAYERGALSMKEYVDQAGSLSKEMDTMSSIYNKLDKVESFGDSLDAQRKLIEMSTMAIEDMTEEQQEYFSGLLEQERQQKVMNEAVNDATRAYNKNMLSLGEYDDMLTVIMNRAGYTAEAQNILTREITSLEGVVNNMSTARTQSEFDAMRKKALEATEAIKQLALATVGISDIPMEASGNALAESLSLTPQKMKSIDRALNDWSSLQKKAQEIKDMEFTGGAIAGGGGGGGKSEATKELEKELKEQEKLREKNLKAIEKYREQRLKDEIDANEDIRDSIKETAEELQDLGQEYKDLAKEATEALQEIDKEINKTRREGQRDVADRIIELEKEIEEKEEDWDNRRSDDLTREERIELRQEIAGLKKELKFAKDNTSDEALAAAREWEAMNETQRILKENQDELTNLAQERKQIKEEFQLKKEALDKEKQLLSEQLFDQMQQYKEHNQTLRGMYANFHGLIEQDTRDHVVNLLSEYDTIVNKLKEVRAMQKDTGTTGLNTANVSGLVDTPTYQGGSVQQFRNIVNVGGITIQGKDMSQSEIEEMISNVFVQKTKNTSYGVSGDSFTGSQVSSIN